MSDLGSMALKSSMMSDRQVQKSQASGIMEGNSGYVDCQELVIVHTVLAGSILALFQSETPGQDVGWKALCVIFGRQLLCVLTRHASVSQQKACSVIHD